MGDLVALRDEVLAPAFDIGSAEKLWGPILEWTGELADLRASEQRTPRLARAIELVTPEQPRERFFDVLVRVVGMA